MVDAWTMPGRASVEASAANKDAKPSLIFTFHLHQKEPRQLQREALSRNKTKRYPCFTTRSGCRVRRCVGSEASYPQGRTRQPFSDTRLGDFSTDFANPRGS